METHEHPPDSQWDEVFLPGKGELQLSLQMVSRGRRCVEEMALGTL